MGHYCKDCGSFNIGYEKQDVCEFWYNPVKNPMMYRVRACVVYKKDRYQATCPELLADITGTADNSEDAVKDLREKLNEACPGFRSSQMIREELNRINFDYTKYEV